MNTTHEKQNHTINPAYSQSNYNQQKIAVIIPCFNVKEHILNVINAIGPEVCIIYVIDDKCPEGTGDYVSSICSDPRVTVIKNSQNLGVGGAVMVGYKKALEDGAEYLVKIDGDNQMNPRLIPAFIAPLLAGDADYVKGNRFFSPELLSKMPMTRLIGNAVLSFLSKFSCGYWNIFDPTNGYTAIHSRVAEKLPLNKISSRYFFETDMLFRLNCLGAVVVDIPLISKYEDERSNLKISRIVPEFIAKHIRNSFKRILYRYLIRDFSVASIELVLGIGLFGFGIIYGTYRWYLSATGSLPAPSGAVMLAALPVLVGVQLLLAFFHYDIMSVPKRPLHPSLSVWHGIKKNLEKFKKINIEEAS